MRRTLAAAAAIALVAIATSPISAQAAKPSGKASTTLTIAMSANHMTSPTSDYVSLAVSGGSTFALPTAGNLYSHDVRLDTLSTNTGTLKNGTYPFTLKATADQVAALDSFFNAGWGCELDGTLPLDPGAYFMGTGPDYTWCQQIGREILGAEPFFYVVIDGSSQVIVDSFKQWLYNTWDSSLAKLTVNDNYPVGLYAYKGTINSIDGSGRTIHTGPVAMTVNLNVTRVI